jgi:type IV secretory pathway TraG/TraD family ATPase VirD4
MWGRLTIYYKSIQFTGTSSVISLIKSLGVVPKAGLIRELLRDQDALKEWSKHVSNPYLYADLTKFISLPPTQFQKDFSGILAFLENFTKGNAAKNLNQSYSDINFEEALLNRNIIYFQLPTLKSPTLASNLGKLVIQTFAAAAGEFQARSLKEPDKIFSLYLDDFNDYMYPGFASVANKVRSAGIAMTFAHQSLGDLNKVSPEFKDIIIENTNNKIILKINDPESADFFASYIGTKSTEKVTERQSKGLMGAQKTGEQSVRNTEEFVIHPNVFKSELAPGDAVAVLNQLNGPRKIERIKCERLKENARTFLPPKTEIPEMTFLNEVNKFMGGKSKKEETKEPPTKSENQSSVPANAQTNPAHSTQTLLAVSQEVINEKEGNKANEEAKQNENPAHTYSNNPPPSV